MKNTGFELKQDTRTKQYRLFKPTKKQAFKVTTVKVTRDGLLSAIATGDPCSFENITQLVDRSDEQVQLLSAGGPNVVELEAGAKLRSAQSMIFYLGELSRFDLDNLEKSPDHDQQNVGANKYWNVSGGGSVNSVISTSVRGVGSIQIPDGHPQTDSTLRMLTLVQQVFDLNTASDKAPTATPVIRLVN